MNFHALSGPLVVITLVFLFTSSTQGKVAQKFLKYNNKSKVYELNDHVLEQMSKMHRPIQVIAVLGDARIGKSTTLNMVNHIWSGVEQNEVEEIFETGDGQKSVTHDVWAHIIHPRDDMNGSIVLLDVAGTNLGDDALTTHLSMFTALISSGLNMFVRETFQNNNLQFLYHLSRLSSIVFPNISLKNFPTLRVLVRGALEAPDGTTIEDFIRESVAEPSFEKNKKEERKTIAKYFPKNQIEVTQIPLVDRKLFRNFTKLRTDEYWNDMKHLVGKFKEVPIKKTLEGSPIDGQALVELAVRLTKTMNTNSWHAFGDVYDALERNICKRSYIKLIEPLFVASKADEIESKMEDVLRAFKNECVLESEAAAALKDLRQIVKKMREIEELKQKAKKAEEERIEAEMQRVVDRQKFEENLSLKDEEIAEQKKANEKIANEVGQLRQLYQESMRSLESLKQALRKRGGGLMDFLGPLAFGAGLGAFLSDRDLKQNITTLPFSPYNAIGLTSVCWEWNKIAEKNFGLAGEECGVVAQDVEKLYPWAVSKGQDGFLRVRYDMLHAMITRCNSLREKNCGLGLLANFCTLNVISKIVQL